MLANSSFGIVSFRKELIVNFIRLNHEVHISVPYDTTIEQVKILGCNIIDTVMNSRGKNPIEDYLLYKHYIKIIKDLKPDVVLTYTIKPNIFGGFASKKLNVPYIVNITGLGSALENKGKLQRLLLYLYKKSLIKAKCVFLQNKGNLDFMLEHNLLPRQHKLIPGSGVNLSKFKYKDYPNEKKLVCIFIGRIMKEKGIDLYFKLAMDIKSKYENVEFHIAGSCEENYLDILNKYSDSGIIIYHGLVNNIEYLYEKAHCLIHPTYYPEGMSNVMLEAAATGRPIIASNRNGCKEIIDDNITGFLFEEKNYDDLYEKFMLFYNMKFIEKRMMGILGNKKVSIEFDRNIIVNEYLNEIDRKPENGE